MRLLTIATNKTIELKTALLIFMGIAGLILAIGILAGKLFFWDKFEVVNPVEKDIAYLEATLAKQQDDKLLVELGYLYYRKGDYQKAISTLSKAVQINERNPAAHFNLGLAYQEVKLLAKAEAEFIRTQELDNASKFAYYALGKLYYTQEKWDEALAQFKLAIEKDPVAVDNYFMLGQTYEHKSYLAEAKAAYKKVLERVPNHSEAKEAYYRLK